MTHPLPAAHGGTLVDGLACAERAAELRGASREWPSWRLGARQICDLEMILSGSFSPLRSFLGRDDYESVCERWRLAGGTLWPVPVTLDVSEDLAHRLAPGRSLALRDAEGVMLAALHVQEVWRPDLDVEARRIYGTTDPGHPGVARLLGEVNPFYVSGRLEGLQLPSHYDFRALRLTPAELRSRFEEAGWTRVVAFQTRNPMHRAHYELTVRAAEEAGARILIHPVVGSTKPGDVDHYTRVRCYQAVLSRYPPNTARLALLPLAMRMAGPREAVWHAIIRKNFGCSHFIVGRDHAGPGRDGQGRPYYQPYAAQQALRSHEAELGIAMVPFRRLVYAEDLDAHVPDTEAGQRRVRDISGTELRRLLSDGAAIPQWFTFPEVAEELQRTHRPRHAQGLTVFFTGLSGSGKSTLANVLLVKLLERGGRPVTLLDGDVVRTHLSSELGFSREHRRLNILRIGFVASEVTKNGGIVLCAPIAPHDDVRKEVRRMIEAVGTFELVHVATPLPVCEARDRKGVYAKARAGLIPEFTGVSAPYEPPDDAELRLDTTDLSPEAAADEILRHLQRRGALATAGCPRP